MFYVVKPLRAFLFFIYFLPYFSAANDYLILGHCFIDFWSKIKGIMLFSGIIIMNFMNFNEL